MSVDPKTIITGAHVALSIIRELQKAVNVSRDARKELDLATVQSIIDKNIKVETEWKKSKTRRKKAESETPAEPGTED
jgi:hypothetical protein